MNGFQFRVAMSAAAAPASTCCSPTSNNSSATRQRSTQCCGLKQQSMWENIGKRRCYTSWGLLSISIPAYCAGKRHPLYRRQKRRNCRRDTIGCDCSQSHFEAFRLAGVSRGGECNEWQVGDSNGVTRIKFNLILLTLWWHVILNKSCCWPMRTILSSFYNIKKWVLTYYTYDTNAYV